jgi:CubicO group peptidase (beta-lactamase class C family)
MILGKHSRIVPVPCFLATLTFVAAFAQQPQPVNRPEELGFAPERLERLTNAFQGAVDQGQLPGAVVLIARNDQVAYFQAFGFRDRERKVPMTTDSIFRIASMTKPIVSTAAMILVEEGKLDLAAPVSQYLPEFKNLQVQTEHQDATTGRTFTVQEPQVRPMIVQDLLRHTAGLVYGPPIGTGPIAELYREADVADRNIPLAEMVTRMSKIPLAHQPGEVWEYSMAVDVLGRVIEVASGMDLDRFVAERVTQPLGMASTGFYIPASDGERVAQPQADASGQKPDMFDPTQKPKRFSGGGGGVSTAADYLRFCEMFLNGGKLGNTRVLAPSTVALMTSNALKPGIGYAATALNRFGDIGPTPAMGQGFGLGFAVRTEPGENPLPGSVGSFYWTGAFGTTFYVDPTQKLIIIMMIQVPLGPAGGTFRHLVRELAYQALIPSDAGSQ